MKKTLFFITIILIGTTFISCNSESEPQEIPKQALITADGVVNGTLKYVEKENSEFYGYNYILKENVSDEIDSIGVHILFHRDDLFMGFSTNIFEKCGLENGQFSFSFSKPSTENLFEINEVLKWNESIKISDETAKIIICKLVGFKNEELNGLLLNMNPVDLSTTFVAFLYADKSVDITGTFSTKDNNSEIVSTGYDYQYDLKLNKGWNTLIWRSEHPKQIFTANDEPTDLIWALELVK